MRLLKTTEKQVLEEKKPTHEFDEEFCWEIKMVKRNKTEILEMKKFNMSHR